MSVMLHLTLSVQKLFALFKHNPVNIFNTFDTRVKLLILETVKTIMVSIIKVNNVKNRLI